MTKRELEGLADVYMRSSYKDIEPAPYEDVYEREKHFIAGFKAGRDAAAEIVAKDGVERTAPLIQEIKSLGEADE